MLVVLTSLLIPFLARIVFISTAVLYPIVFALVTFGVYSINYSMGDVTIALIAGVVGYVMLKLDYAPVPLVLGLVLGPLVERGMRRTLILSEGDLSVFAERPIALTFLLLTVAVIAVPLIVSRFRPAAPSSL
jgi:putative tricarboxylic transport membrane protein